MSGIRAREIAPFLFLATFGLSSPFGLCRAFSSLVWDLAKQAAKQDFHEHAVAGVEPGKLQAHALAGSDVANHGFDVDISAGDFKAEPQVGADSGAERLDDE